MVEENTEINKPKEEEPKLELNIEKKRIKIRIRI